MKVTTETKPNRRANVFATVFGLFLGLTLLKFGTPCILDKMVDRPTNLLEWLLNPWPVEISLLPLAALVLFEFSHAKLWLSGHPGRPAIAWPIFPLLAWFFWQLTAAHLHTVDLELTRATLAHFTECFLCSVLGAGVLVRAKSIAPFLFTLLVALIVVILVGWQQHFGGLAETRAYFMTYIYPTLKTVPPEFMKRMTNDRIYSTLFYPNTLAGALLLLLPPLLAFVWSWRERFTTGARGLLVTLLGVGAAGCLVWSGSKSGWLLALVLGMLALLRADFARKLKVLLVGAVLVAGLAGFGLKYAGYFQRGATSVSARGDYWRAAWQTACANPVFGTGPGTFAIPYTKLKRPDAEMARLTHNDYLQQASDSGFPGAVLYLAFIAGSLWVTWRRISRADWLRFSVWLGLLGWSLQNCVEFGLYIPALAWPAFALFGWLLGSTSPKKPAAA